MYAVLIFALLQPLLRDDFEHRLGLVWADQEGTCLAIDNHGLQSGAEVFVVPLTANPARTFRAYIESPVSACGHLLTSFSDA